MTEKRLDYDRSLVPQETGWWCGPASTQTVLQAKGIRIPEREIAAAIEEIENPGRGDDKDGTDWIGIIETYLDRKVPEGRYTSVLMPNDPPTQVQKDRLWRHLVQSIDAGWGVVANIVAPPFNPPRAVKGSTPPPYPRGITTYHYVALMGYDDQARAVWVADSAAFGGITGWWCPFDGPGSICSLIPPKGYAYADVVAPKPEPKPEPPKPAPVDFTRTDQEWRATQFGDQDAVAAIVAAAKMDNRGRVALALLERVNPAALQAFITKG